MVPYRKNKVVTTLVQGCHNLGTRLYAKLLYKIATKLYQPCKYIVFETVQGCYLKNFNSI